MLQLQDLVSELFEIFSSARAKFGGRLVKFTSCTAWITSLQTKKSQRQTVAGDMLLRNGNFNQQLFLLPS